MPGRRNDRSRTEQLDYVTPTGPSIRTVEILLPTLPPTASTMRSGLSKGASTALLDTHGRSDGVECRALVERTTSERMWSGIAQFFASMGPESGAKRTPDHATTT